MLSRLAPWLSLALLVLLAAYVVMSPPKRLEGTMLDRIPMVLAGMPGQDLGLEQTVLDDLDPDAYLVRSYERPDGLPVWLVIVYFQNARLGAHDPELCYRSQGFEVEDLPAGRHATEVGDLPFRSFVASKGPRAELVRYFWYTAGGQVLSEVTAWRDKMFFQGLKTNRSFGAFIRISTLEGGTPGMAEESIQRVAAELAPLLPELFPEDGTQEDQG